MKYKLIASLLALAIASWAQTTSPAPPSASGKAAQATWGWEDPASMAGEGNHCMQPNAFVSGGKEAMRGGPVKDAKQAASCGKGRDSRACGKDSKDAVGCRGHGAEGHEMACGSAEDGKPGNHGCGENPRAEHCHHEHAQPGN
jgi:hypothetical protein